jgi:hypothetical protein
MTTAGFSRVALPGCRVTLAQVLLAASCSYSQAGDGNDVLRNCESVERREHNVGRPSPADYVGIGQCLGAVESVIGTLTIAGPKPGERAAVCLPDAGVTNGQAAKAALVFLRMHPGELHRNGTSLLIEAYRGAFPCP